MTYPGTGDRTTAASAGLSVEIEARGHCQKEGGAYRSRTPHVELFRLIVVFCSCSPRTHRIRAIVIPVY